MTTYNTGNPLGSTEVKDLYDNAQNLDVFSNGQDPEYADRFGVSRKSLAGLRQDFADFLIASGYEFLGDYDSPGEITFTRPNQAMSKDGDYWRPGPSLVLPYTTVNNWVIDQPKFVSIGDAALRQDLALPTGSQLVGYGSQSVKDALDALQGGAASDFGVNVKSFGAIGDGVADDTAAIQAAFNSLVNGTGILRFPKGIYNYTLLNFDSAVSLVMLGEGALNASILRCTSVGATDGFKIRSVFHVTIDLITFDHASASFNGWLVDTRHKPASAVDSQNIYFSRCAFSSQGYNKYTAKGLNLDQSTLITFDGCMFISLFHPIDGQNPAGGGYSNGVRVLNCQFYDNVGYALNYLGEQWTVQDNNFQACHDGQQRIAFSDNATTWRNLVFINNGVYDATAAGSSYLSLGNGQCLTVNGGLWGGRSDLGSSAFLNATGGIIGINIHGALFSLFTNVFVFTGAGSGGADISGNFFASCTNYLVNPSNVTGINMDNNVPPISQGTLPVSSGLNSVRYNHDGSIEMTGSVGVNAGVSTPVAFPIANFPNACWDVQLTLQSPAATSNVASLAGGPTATGFNVFVNGSGASTVRWRAIGR